MVSMQLPLNAALQAAAMTNDQCCVLLQTLHSVQPTLEKLLQGKPLEVHLQGLEYMNDDPSAMHVAYVGVRDPSEAVGGQGSPQGAEGAQDGDNEKGAFNLQGSRDKLQTLCGIFVDAFSDAGLLLSRDER